MYLHFYMKSYCEKMLKGWGPYIRIPLSIPTIFTLRPGGLEKQKGKNMQETWSGIDTAQGEEGIFVCVRLFPTLLKIRQFWEAPCSKTGLWGVLLLWKERRKCNFSLLFLYQKRYYSECLCFIISLLTACPWWVGGWASAPVPSLLSQSGNSGVLTVT